MSRPAAIDQAADRRRKLAAIHAAAAKLGLDTADKSPGSAYRTILQAQGGVTSAADLDADGRRKVLAYLLRQANPTGTPAPKGGWQLAKIEALWRELGATGALRDPSPTGLADFVQARQGVSSPLWLNTQQANHVVEALKAWKARALASAAAGATVRA